MMQAVLHLITTQPQLLVEHAQAYAELVGDETRTVSTLWKRQALLNAVALCCLGVGTVLAGVALMLWAVIPAVSAQALWALLGAPLLPLAVALGCWRAAQRPSENRAFDSVRQQLQADLQMLRETAAT
jgi:uncharacterized membrane protein YqjE